MLIMSLLQLDAVVESTNATGFFARAGPLKVFTGEKVRHGGMAQRPVI